MAKRKLDHFAHLVDRVAEAADVVIGHIGPARLLGLLELRAKLISVSAVIWTIPRGWVETTTRRISCRP